MQEYGEPQDQIDKRLKLMGVKQSAARKLAPPSTDKKVLEWIPGKGWKK
jgi:hypothetical protein